MVVESNKELSKDINSGNVYYLKKENVSLEMKTEKQIKRYIERWLKLEKDKLVPQKS